MEPSGINKGYAGPRHHRQAVSVFYSPDRFRRAIRQQPPPLRNGGGTGAFEEEGSAGTKRRIDLPGQDVVNRAGAQPDGSRYEVRRGYPGTT